MEQINLQKVSKMYDKQLVLDELDYSIAKGDSIAFTGHNGCGKSTLLKIIAGLVKPTKGKVNYSSHFLFHYVPDQFPILSLSARTYLKRMGQMDGLLLGEVNKKIKQEAESFFITEYLDIPMKFLSKGTLQKISVIQALLTTPDLLLLDEPLSGLDWDSKRIFIEKINHLREQDVTILMSCHEKGLIEKISSKVLKIEKGKLLPVQLEENLQIVLFLQNPKGNPLWPKMKAYRNGYQLIIEETRSQEVLLQLLKNGWILKGMVKREDLESGQISNTSLF